MAVTPTTAITSSPSSAGTSEAAAVESGEFPQHPIARTECRLPMLPLRECDRRYCPQIGLAGALKITLLVELLYRFLGGVTFCEVVMERQFADARGECFCGSRGLV